VEFASTDILFSKKVTKIYTGEKTVSSTNDAGKTGFLPAED
jgi:hypothetical protein